MNTPASQRAGELDAEAQFRAEQTRLAVLQDQLDKLDELPDSLNKK